MRKTFIGDFALCLFLILIAEYITEWEWLKAKPDLFMANDSAVLRQGADGDGDRVVNWSRQYIAELHRENS